MGYYSAYDLTVTKVGSESDAAALKEIAREIEKLEVLECGNLDGSYWFCHETKWYEDDDDMIRISEMFPEYLFVLERYGEDREDFGRTYYQGGRSHYCAGTMSFEPFDRE